MRLISLVLRAAALGLLLAVLLGYGGALVFQLDLLANFRLHLLGLSVAAGALALALRDGPALAVSGAAALAAVAGLSPLWQEPPPPGPGRELTVMAANLYLHNPVPKEMRAALLAADADILVTVETPSALAGGLSLADVYPHHLEYIRSGVPLNTVIWSKFPIRESRMITLAKRFPTAAYALVEIAPGQEVAIVGLHLGHVVIGEQGREVERLGRATAGLPRPLVLMGDFNATPWSHALDRIEELTGTERVAGVGTTWRGRYPTPVVLLPEPFGLTLDHILISDGIGVESIGTVRIPGSDHLGVRAVLTVPDAAAPSARAGKAVSTTG